MRKDHKHLLDIARDTVHTVINAAKALFMPFDGYAENICSDMFYDIEKSPKAKELIGEIQILIKVVSSNKQKMQEEHFQSIFYQNV